jgi:hypothetical protein
MTDHFERSLNDIGPSCGSGRKHSLECGLSFMTTLWEEQKPQQQQQQQQQEEGEGWSQKRDLWKFGFVTRQEQGVVETIWLLLAATMGVDSKCSQMSSCVPKKVPFVVTRVSTENIVTTRHDTTRPRQVDRSKTPHCVSSIILIQHNKILQPIKYNTIQYTSQAVVCCPCMCMYVHACM